MRPAAWCRDVPEPPLFEPLEGRLLLSSGPLPPLDALPVDSTFLACDVNFDGKVDGGDLAVWQQHYDPLGGNNTYFDGDVNGDGKVDGADLALWQQNYQPTPATPSTTYAQFNQFAIDNFGAEKEPLAYDMFGTALELVDSGEWQYVSTRSASIAFATNLPARSYISFGATASYGRMTVPSDRPFSTHTHYLTDLQPQTPYHYRIVSMDERANVLTSEDRTFTTVSTAGKILLSGIGSGPWTLDESGATYVLDGDVVASGTAFIIEGNNVTLDLGGHTVIYNNVHNPLASSNFWDYIHDADFGIKTSNISSHTGITILNGTVKQGAGNDAAETYSSIGFNPIYLRGTSNVVVAGVTVSYGGAQNIGMYNHWQGTNQSFHHNVFLDNGTTVRYRHGFACRSLIFGGSSNPNDASLDYNLVKRTRQNGIAGLQVNGNEIYIDSWAVNSFGMSVSAGGTASGNRIFGTGYYVVAVGWSDNATYHDNFIHLQGEAPTTRSTEMGAYALLVGMRLTQYSGGTKLMRNNLYYDNVISLSGRGGSILRGVAFYSDPYVSDLIFRDNIVKVIAQDSATTMIASIVTQGNSSIGSEALPIYYVNNTFISNLVNVRFGDSYGVGSNHRFINSTFVREGNDPGYHTFYFTLGYPSKNHVIQDPVFEGGASLNSVHWVNSTADHDFTVQWTLTVHTAAGASVIIEDEANDVVFSGTADGSGVVAVPLSWYKAKYAGNTLYTPHTVTVVNGGQSASAVVTMDHKQDLTLYPPVAGSVTVFIGADAAAMPLDLGNETPLAGASATFTPFFGRAPEPAGTAIVGAAFRKRYGGIRRRARYAHAAGDAVPRHTILWGANILQGVEPPVATEDLIRM